MAIQPRNPRPRSTPRRDPTQSDRSLHGQRLGAGRDEPFDVAVCIRAYEYVNDIERALAEARRVLRPDGRLLLLNTA